MRRGVPDLPQRADIQPHAVEAAKGFDMKKQTIPLPKGERSLTRVVAFLSSLPTDKAFKVEVSELRNSRSDGQNNALWGVAYKTLSEFTGHTGPELHDAFLRAYFGEVEKDVFGKKVIKPRRTTTTDEEGNRSLLSTMEFRDFYSFVQQKGAEIGCWVPDPDPLWFARDAA